MQDDDWGLAGLMEPWSLAPGLRAVWRSVRAGDEALLGEFIAGLSRQTRFERFHGAVREPTPSLLAQLSQVDFRHHAGFILTLVGEISETMIADARFVADDEAECADFALVIADRWQGRGLGARVLQSLAGAARRRGLRWLRAEVREDNVRMLALLKRCGFFRAPHPEEGGLLQCVKLLLPPTPGQAGAAAMHAMRPVE